MEGEVARRASSPGAFRWLIASRGDRRWDIFLRGTAVAALALIPAALYLPEYTALVWLAVVGLPANGPLGPVLPTAFEPIIMVAAKYHPPVEVALVATASYMYMEFLNWHIYRWLLSLKKLRALKDKKWTKKGIEHFSRAPFLTTMVVAATPIPFWLVRCLSIMREYSFGRYMVATAIGRFPRMFMWAWLGEKLMVPSVALVGFAIGTAVLLAIWRFSRGKSVLPDLEES